MQDKPLISVILPTYNGERFVAQSIESVLRQSYANLELVVSDDASHDSTLDIIRSFQDGRIRLITNAENKGLSANLNRALRESKGDYICWLNQDDVFYPDKLEKQLRVMQEGNYGAVFSAKDDIDNKGEPLKQNNPSLLKIPEDRILLQLFVVCHPVATTVMLPRRVVEEVGEFREDLKIAMDYDMWFRILEGHDIYLMRDVLMGFRHHEQNLSSTNHRTTVMESASVLSSAIRRFPIERIFPELQPVNGERKPVNSYLKAYVTFVESLARSPFAVGIVDEVIGIVLKMLELNFNFHDACLIGRDICTQIGDRARGELFEKQVERLEQRYSNLLLQLDACILSEDQEGFSQTMKEMENIHPLDGDPQYQAALLYYQKGRKEDAERFLSVALSINPNNERYRELKHLLDS